MTTTSTARPPLGTLHHVAITVGDIEVSAEWYQRVLGLQRLPAPTRTAAASTRASRSCSSNLPQDGRSVSTTTSPTATRSRTRLELVHLPG